MDRNEAMSSILREQVVPALGCTEPGAIAYAVSRAKELLGGDTIRNVAISVDKNILKNGLDVGIPGTCESGIVFAAALALQIGNAGYMLEALKNVTPAAIDAAKQLAADGTITLELAAQAKGLYVSVDVAGEQNTARVIIADAHTNIVYESANGTVLTDRRHPLTCDDTSTSGQRKLLLKDYAIADMVDFANEVPLCDIAFLQDGIDMNMAIAQSGIDGGLELCVSLNETEGGLRGRAKAYTAAGSEARMSGSPLPVMSSAGSGNHGMTAIVPIEVYGAGKQIPRERILRAVALSHLVTVYTKIYLGPLSPVCGCGVAAGVGCACGLTYLQGGTLQQIYMAVNNMVAGISGMICDGAKLGCALKVACAVSAAVDAANIALKGACVPNYNGILSSTPELTLQNLATVSVVGMCCTDDTILDLMLHRV